MRAAIRSFGAYSFVAFRFCMWQRIGDGRKRRSPKTPVQPPRSSYRPIGCIRDLGFRECRIEALEGLQGRRICLDATGISLFFWKVDGSPVQFEVRFYSSHDEAFRSGLSYAIEGAGPQAIIDADFARYTEGLRDRRTIVHTRASPTPRYGDFVVYGNMIALCEGRDSEQGAERCARLVEALDTTGQ